MLGKLSADLSLGTIVHGQEGGNQCMCLYSTLFAMLSSFLACILERFNTGE